MTEPTRLWANEWRIDGAAKVRGETRYAADVSRAGMLHAAFVTSPHPHALVRSVDVSGALRVPGVRAVLTGQDVHPARLGRHLQDWPLLAWDRVRFIGDRVAAVAAETRQAADEAVKAVRVSYDSLPAVFDADLALSPDAPILHPDAYEYHMVGDDPRPRVSHPNLQNRLSHEHGDLAAGFAQAARVFAHTYELARVHNGYLEPRACLVWIDGSVVRVVTTNKAPFELRRQMATTLDLPEDRIDVETVTIGGDFGGKGLSLDEHVCVFLARATGRPVRSVLRYTDELQTSTTRRSTRIRLRTGIDRNGRITAHEARIVYDCGAYAAGGASPRILPGASLLTLLGYSLPAVRIEALGVYTNQLPGGSVRAPGQPQVVFASESHVDQIARELGLDPLVFRERNLARTGDRTARGETWHGSAMPALIDTIRPRVGGETVPGERRGSGVALGFRHQGIGRAAVKLTVRETGDVEVLTGVPDQGAGVLAVIQRVVSQELGIPARRVHVRRGSTSMTAEDPGIGGSKSTIVHGGAALDAARRLVRELQERAPGRTVDDALRSAAPCSVEGRCEQRQHAYGACAVAVEVCVDEETGAFVILRGSVAVDVGTVIDPVAARGQVEGGFVFGLGQAIMEEAVVNEGRLAGPNLGDYKIPTVADVPPLEVTLYSGDLGFGPRGAKSIGELVNPVVGAAVANAIADAAGVRVASLPITAEKVRAAFRRQAVARVEDVRGRKGHTI